MAKYRNLGKNSGVKNFDNQRGSLTVGFKDGSHYIYTQSSAGQYAMRRMRELAQRGRGLNSYINTSVKKGYDSKH